MNQHSVDIYWQKRQKSEYSRTSFGQDYAKRFCRFCDVCQRTVKRGSVRKVPLGSMPLIDTPFKRVAVDIVRPIAPPSEAGHWYILTLVDYTTRYPEAVPLKKITTEAVAEALLDIYSRVGTSEELLTDQGTRFMSECMQEVSRLLSIKGLTSTPYQVHCHIPKANSSSMPQT